MDRAIPAPNKLISKKIYQRNRQIHLNKLSNVKSTISREPPQSFGHLKSNKKKNQIYEDRLTEIERENKILLDKMTTIMKINHQPTNLNPQASGPILDKSALKSLNVDSRKRELVKIAVENQFIMKRLSDQKPFYNRQMWEESRKQHELYLRNISEYPLASTVSTFKSPDNSDNRPQTFQAPRESDKPLTSAKTIDKFYSPNKGLHSSDNKFPPIKNIKNEKLDPLKSPSGHKTLLYQTKKKIGFSNYLIHVYLNNDTFNVIASNNERADFKMTSLSLKEGEELVRSFGGNYKDLVDKIQFRGPKIVFEGSSSILESTNGKKAGHVTHDGIVETDDEQDGDTNKSPSKPKTPKAEAEKKGDVKHENKAEKEKKLNENVKKDEVEKRNAESHSGGSTEGKLGKEIETTRSQVVEEKKGEEKKKPSVNNIVDSKENLSEAKENISEHKETLSEQKENLSEPKEAISEPKENSEKEEEIKPSTAKALEGVIYESIEDNENKENEKVPSKEKEIESKESKEEELVEEIEGQEES